MATMVLAPIVWFSLFSWFFSPIALLMPVFLGLIILLLIFTGIDPIFKTRLKIYGFIAVILLPCLLILSIPVSVYLDNKSRTYAERMVKEAENYHKLHAEYPTDEYMKTKFRTTTFLGSKYEFHRRYNADQQKKYCCVEFVGLGGTTCYFCSDDYTWGGYD
jgi:hypothetical protein